MKYRVTFNLERVLEDGRFEEIAFGNTLHYTYIDEAMDEARQQLADEDGCWPFQQFPRGMMAAINADGLVAVASDIVSATREVPRAAFGDVLSQYTHLLCDDEKASIVATHINAAVGGPAGGERRLRALLQRHAHDDVEATINAAEVALAESDLRRVFDNKNPGSSPD